MRFQRPQFLMAGIILLVFSVQFMYVDSYILTPAASQLLSSQLDIPRETVLRNRIVSPASNRNADSTLHDITAKPKPEPATPNKKTDLFSEPFTVQLPNWMGWSFLIGAGLCFICSIRAFQRDA